jgi:uncharacterized protein (TIGR03435 family)
MKQPLLRDRFQMKMHRETREIPVYGLVIGKGGLKLKDSLVDSPANGVSLRIAAITGPWPSVLERPVTYDNGAYFTFGNNRF